MELHAQISNLAQKLYDHTWSKRITDRDSNFVGELYKKLIALSNESYRLQLEAKANVSRITELENEVSWLKTKDVLDETQRQRWG